MENARTPVRILAFVLMVASYTYRMIHGLSNVISSVSRKLFTLN